MNYNTNVLYITRFIASVLIVILHFAPKTFWVDYYSLFKNSGEGVNYFFFISGFVMIIANKNFIGTNDKYSVFPKKTFWIKRVARIYPLYVFSLLLVLVYHYFIAAVDTSVLLKLPFELLAVQRWVYFGSINIPGWTISCELLFYIAFPFLVPYINRNLKRYTYGVLLLFLIATIFSCMLFFFKQVKYNQYTDYLINTIYLHPIFKLPIFMLGTLCGVAYIKNTFKFLNSRPKVIFCTCISSTLIFSALYILPKDYYLIEVGLLSIVYFFLILSICNLKGKETVLFNSKYSIFLGDISYGIYILQYPVFLFYKHYAGNIDTTLQLVYFVSTSIIIAAIIYYLFEVPFKRLILSAYYKHEKTKVLNIELSTSG